MKNICLISLAFLLLSCQDNIVLFEPILVSDEPTNVFTTSAILGGEVFGEGGVNVTEYGIVYSTSFPPTINDNKFIEGERIGRFSNTYTDLLPGTTYYYSSYAINSIGAGYGGVYEFTTQNEASCNPLDNYIDFETDIIGFQDGNFSNVSVLIDSGLRGGDYTIRAENGIFSTATDIDINFDGDINNLLSGAYPTITDLDFAFQIPNKTVVTLYHNSRTIISEENTLYVEKNGNVLTFTLCDFVFNYSINFVDYPILVNSKFSVEL